MANYATGTGLTPLIVFPVGNGTRTLEIIYAPATNLDAVHNDIYDFVPVNSDVRAWDYVNNSGSYAYSPPPAPTPQPYADYQGFLNACYANPGAAQFPIALVYCQAFAQPGLTQSQLQTLVATGTSVITTAYPANAAGIIAAIAGYLTQFNIPH